MKRGYLWVDWVELGCRGWGIDHTGAELVDGDSFAHLDRTTLDLAFGGHRKHFVRVVNDLRAAGITKYAIVATFGTATAGSAANVGEWRVDLDGMGSRHIQEWSHPSGATLRLTAPVLDRPKGRFARWWDTVRKAYLDAFMIAFYAWWKQAQKIERETRKVA